MSSFGLFVLASLVLAVTPGPAVIFLLTRTLSQGRRIGLASMAGVALGNFGNSLVASLGLAVIFAASSRAFVIIKLAGAAYLVVLGLRALATRPAPSKQAAPAPVSRQKAFRDGFLVALLNPKTALFFAAFLPQFIRPGGSPLPQSIALGGAFVMIALCTDASYVLAAAALGPKAGGLFARRSFGRYVTGTTFIALGIYVAFGGSARAHHQVDAASY